MAKGQIHMGKNGPERCTADTSNPKSRGCPYAATGHYSTESEAMDNYATLNRVDAEELSALVKDGASPKDAVGLIRTGYGSGYLEAARKDEKAPDTTWKDATNEYLDSKQAVEQDLKERFSDKIEVKVANGSNSNETSVIIEATKGQPSERFSYAVNIDNDSGDLSLNMVSRGKSKMTESVRDYLSKNVADRKSPLHTDFGRMLKSSKEMLAFERAATK